MIRLMKNIEVKKAIQTAIKGLNTYKISCGIFECDAHDGKYLYNLMVTIFNRNGGIIEDLYIIELEKFGDLDEKEQKEFFKELDKITKYLEKHFLNVQKINEIIG